MRRIIWNEPLSLIVANDDGLPPEGDWAGLQPDPPTPEPTVIAPGEGTSLPGDAHDYHDVDPYGTSLPGDGHTYHDVDGAPTYTNGKQDGGGAPTGGGVDPTKVITKLFETAPALTKAVGDAVNQRGGNTPAPGGGGGRGPGGGPGKTDLKRPGRAGPGSPGGGVSGTTIAAGVAAAAVVGYLAFGGKK